MLELAAGVAINGAILLGNNFCADGHDGDRKGFAISHMHEDHASMVPECLHSGAVYMTDPTRQLLEVLRGDRYRTVKEAKKLNCIGRKNIKILGYGQTSWGPTGFAFLPNYQKAKKIKYKLEKKFGNCNDLEFIICSGKNTGATIKINK